MTSKNIDCNIPPFLPKTKQKTKNNTDLPSLSKNIHRLLSMVTNSKTDNRQLAKIIKQSPAISTRLIFLANSAWTSPKKPVNNVEQACTILGHSIVKSVSFGISISSSFDPGKCRSFKIDHFWTTSMLVSEGAGLLASKLSDRINHVDFEQTAQSAGLLHNIGLLWLADNLPKETNKALQHYSAEPLSTINEALLEYTGTDYCEVGAWLGDQLGFPEVLIIAIKHHLNNQYQESCWETALIVESAAAMVAALRHQCKEVPKNTRLVALGLDLPTQQTIFQQLSENFEKTQELAESLFTT